MAENDQRRSKRKKAAVVAGVVIGLIIAGIALFVAPARVPDVLMQKEPEGVVLLEDAGLRVGERTEVPTSSIGSGLIVAQRPSGGDVLIRGGSVDLAVAVPPAPAEVPGVVGMDDDAATAVLRDAGFAARIIDVFDPDATPGEVIGQVPAASTTWTTGRAVALGVSAGPDDGSGVPVPDIVGLLLTDALKQLEAAGLEGEGFVVDPTAGDSKVLEQLPAAGLVVGPGTTVLILADNP